VKLVDEANLPAGDVLVGIEHSTLNYKDGLAITNKGPVVRSWPMVAGIDGAGTVLESRHPAWKAGDRVVHNGWGVGETRWGCLAERASLQGDGLVALPAAFSTAQAMALLGYLVADGLASLFVVSALFGLIDALEKINLRPETKTKIKRTRENFAKSVKDEAEREAREYAAKAAEREATWPSFSVGALYFPPTTAMPFHSYGATASMSLPWLWGAAGDRKDAAREFAHAAATGVEAARIPVDAEVVTAEAKARSAAYRLQVLRDRTLPASRHSFEVAQSGFESNRMDLMTVLDTRRSVVDVEHDIVMARSDLDHALTDLEAAVGAEIPLKPLKPLDDKQFTGGDRVH